MIVETMEISVTKFLFREIEGLLRLKLVLCHGVFLGIFRKFLE